MTDWVGTPGKDSVAIAGPRPAADVLAFGADRTGVTDSLAAFVAARDVLPSTGGMIFVPEGTYLFSNTFTLNTKRVHLFGAGLGITILKLANAANANLIEVDYGQAEAAKIPTLTLGYIAHLTLDGNSANQTSATAGLRIIKATDFYADNLQVKDFRGNGIHAAVLATGPQALGTIHITHSRIEYNLQNGIYLGPGVDGIHITDNDIGDNGTLGQDYYNVFAEFVAGQAACGGIVLSGNAIWQGKRANIRLHGANTVKIVNNRILSAQRQNILITGDATRNSYLIAITGNSLHSTGEEATGTYPHIQIGTGATSIATNVSVIGNLFSSPAGFLASTNVDEDANSDENVIAGNTVDGSVTTFTIRGANSQKVANPPDSSSQIIGLRIPSGDIQFLYNGGIIYPSTPTDADLAMRANGIGLLTLQGAGATGNLVLCTGGGDIKWGKALVALGGGAAPTLGTIGGSGPTAAGQNTWMRVLDSTGAACWVPVWK